MIDLSRIKKFNESEKVVLIRFDLNVPLDSDQLHKSERIIRIKKTIKKLLSLNSKIIILSHIGRPKGKAVETLSLKQLVEPMKKALNNEVVFISDCIGPKVKQKISDTDSSKIILIETSRLYTGAEENDSTFAKSLS